LAIYSPRDPPSRPDPCRHSPGEKMSISGNLLEKDLGHGEKDRG
jgi:hypothetical protein